MSHSLSPISFTGSGAPQGRLLQSGATSDPGETLHAINASPPSVPSGYVDTGLDVVIVSAVNTDALDQTINIQWGGSGVANRISKTLTTGVGLMLVIDREFISRSDPITVWCSKSAVVNIFMQRSPYFVLASA